MLKLIAWVLGAYAVYHLWSGVRREQRERGGARGGSQSSSGIDRTQVVDAEFTEVDDAEEKPK